MSNSWNPVTRINDDAIHLDDLQISFHRTLRVPDNHDSSKLPPSLGRFPLYNAVDYAETLPRKMVKKGGAFLSMYRREAMWIKFVSQKPYAVRLFVGGVNAVSGKPIQSSSGGKGSDWDGTRKWDDDQTQQWKQDYMVVPMQKWIDGIATQPGIVQQFVAMPTGSGYSVEVQVTGKEQFAGMLFSVTPGRAIVRKLDVRVEGKMKAGEREQRNFTIPVSLDDTITMVKRTIWEQGKREIELHPLDRYDLEYSGAILEGDRTLDSYGIEANSTLVLKVKPQRLRHPNPVRFEPAQDPTIHIVLRLPGGGGGFGGRPPWYQGPDNPETVNPSRSHEMGIAAGGRISQVIEADPKMHYWSTSKTAWFNVQILNSSTFEEVTGLPSPDTPVDPELYAKHGYPFYELWGEEYKKAVAGNFKGVRSIGQIDRTVDSNLEVRNIVTIKTVWEGDYNYDVKFFQDNKGLPEFRSVAEWERYFA